MRDVFIGGAGMTRFGKHAGQSLRSLAAEAVDGAMADSGLPTDAVGAVYFGNAAAGVLSGQEMIRGQVALRPTGLLGKPIINVENACASGSTAAHLAWLSVASGQCDVALAVGAEKLIHEDKQRSFAAIASGTNLLDLDLGSSAGEVVSTGSVMMGEYAKEAAAYLQRHGAGADVLAAVAVKNRAHAALNPLAQFRDPASVEEVLASRTVAAPLTLLMCAPLTDGAAAIVFCSEDVARPLAGAPVRILASAIVSGGDGPADAVERAARRAFELSGVGPDDLDVIELHDAAAPAEITQYEQIGLCGAGEGHKLLTEGETSLGGRIPVNTSGGLLSRGHPLGATGCAQLFELVHQLRGAAGDRQVNGARVALAVNAGGWMGSDYAATVATVLDQ